MRAGGGCADPTGGGEARKPGADRASTVGAKAAAMTVPHITRLTAVVLAAGALAAPAAVARPAVDQGSFTADNAAAVDRAVAVEPDGAAASAPVVEQIDTGIDWGSVALGAGIGGMVVLLASAGGTTYRRRHHHVPLAP